MAPSEYARMRSAEDQHWWYRSLRRLVIGLLSQYAPTAARVDVLDAGCGTGGGLAEWPRVLGGRGFGIDLAEEALTYCHERGEDLIAQASVESLPFRDGAFDAAVSLDVICRVGVDEERALAELHRVVRSRGLLIVNVPAFGSLRGEHDLAVRTRRRYARGEVEDLLRRAGFEVLLSSYWNALMLPIVWAARRMRASRESGPAHSDVGPVLGPLNAVLVALLAAEARLVLRRGLPFGTSVLCAARRP